MKSIKSSLNYAEITLLTRHDPILKNWSGRNPVSGNNVRLFNFTDIMEHRLFDLREYYSMEEEEVSFLPEAEAKLLLTKNQIPADDPEKQNKIDDIHEAVNPMKVDGRRITITLKGDTLGWVIPGNRQTMRALRDAFDIAAVGKCHVAFEIKPYSFETSMKIFRARRPNKPQILKVKRS